MTTAVADTALLLDVMAGPDGRDRTCLPPPPGSYLDALGRLDLSGLRVAWSKDLGFAVVDPEVAAICEQAAARFASATGAVVVDRPIALSDYTAHLRLHGGRRQVRRYRPHPVGDPTRRTRPPVRARPGNTSAARPCPKPPPSSPLAGIW